MSAAPPEVPGFAIERRLGAGGSCEVWLAREREGLRRPVALKVFVGAPAAYERELEAVRQVEALRRETRSQAFVQSLATGAAGDLAFIAFEVLEGTLQEQPRAVAHDTRVHEAGRPARAALPALPPRDDPRGDPGEGAAADARGRARRGGRWAGRPPRGERGSRSNRLGRSLRASFLPS